jgi:rare lipoprotein A
MRQQRAQSVVLRFMRPDDSSWSGRGLLVGIAAALTLAGCAQQPRQTAQRSTSEYFPSSKYGAASPRVVADGEAVPRGGGQYLVGKPYSVAGKRYRPGEMAVGQSQTGKASWYGSAFHGRKTANGEVYDMRGISAAHPTMPLPSYARVTNQENGRSIIVRVNDRGPYHGGRVLDLSSRAADALDTKRMGTASVKVEYLGPAGLAGSDDTRLLASLRTDGRPATLDGTPTGAPVMVAEAPQQPNFLQRMAMAQTTSVPASPPPVNQAFQAPPAQPVAAPAAAPQVAALRPAVMPANAPVPPSRPFDLGTIPGAGVPIGAPQPRLRQAFATFYAPRQDAIAAKLQQEHAFDAVDRLESSRRLKKQ